jgi:hypothetical protein
VSSLRDSLVSLESRIQRAAFPFSNVLFSPPSCAPPPLSPSSAVPQSPQNELSRLVGSYAIVDGRLEERVHEAIEALAIAREEESALLASYVTEFNPEGDKSAPLSLRLSPVHKRALHDACVSLQCRFRMRRARARLEQLRSIAANARDARAAAMREMEDRAHLERIALMNLRCDVALGRNFNTTSISHDATTMVNIAKRGPLPQHSQTIAELSASSHGPSYDAMLQSARQTVSQRLLTQNLSSLAAEAKSLSSLRNKALCEKAASLELRRTRKEKTITDEHANAGLRALARMLQGKGEGVSAARALASQSPPLSATARVAPPAATLATAPEQLARIATRDLELSPNPDSPTSVSFLQFEESESPSLASPTSRVSIIDRVLSELEAQSADQAVSVEALLSPRRLVPHLDATTGLGVLLQARHEREKRALEYQLSAARRG